MTKKNILFILGVPDNKEIILDKVKKDSSLDVRLGGSTNLFSLIQSNEFNNSMLTLDASQTQDITIQNVHAIFNEISDPDTHKITLSKLNNLSKNIPDTLRLFNAPANVMKTTRDNIYTLLHSIDKLHIPKTVRIQPKSPVDIYETIKKESFTFPIIFRQAGDHGGISTIKIDDDTEKFYAFPLDGREYYLTQFVETSVNGLYTKYRLVVIEGKVFLRHVLIGDTWIVHDKTQLNDNNTDKTAASKKFSREIQPAIQPTISKIHTLLGLDYFGIDCHLDKDMNLVVFEINASMNIFIQTKNSIFKKHIDKMHQALNKMLIT